MRGFTRNFINCYPLLLKTIVLPNILGCETAIRIIQQS
jgi:hypothetical protein